MLNKCEKCTLEAEWRERYLIAEKRFDKALKQAITVTFIAVLVAFSCIILTIMFGIRVVQFIEGFEYVEEIEIEQTEGNNTAILGREGQEVHIYGAEN